MSPAIPASRVDGHPEARMNGQCRVESLDLRKVIPWDRNPRRITVEARAALKASLERFGYVEPIVVNRRGRRLELIGGHQRASLLLESGVKQVACAVVSLPKAEAQALAISLNNPGAQGEYTEDLGPLIDELRASLGDDAAVDLRLDELRGALSARDGLTDPDAVPDISDGGGQVTHPGDLWILGEHRLICGDAISVRDITELMAGERATLMFTDPPYGVSIGKKNRLLNSVQKAGRNLADIPADTMGCEELRTMLLSAFKLAAEQLADDAAVFVCSPQGGSLGLMMMMMMMEAGLEVRHVLNWVKNAPTFSLGRLDYDYQHEPILFTWKKTHKRRKAGPFQTSVWNVDKPRASKEHATMKPVALPANAIQNHTDPGDVVLDPFAGSGTTLIACEQLGRKCRAIEIEPRYVDVAVRRWEAFTGRKAERAK